MQALQQDSVCALPPAQCWSGRAPLCPWSWWDCGWQWASTQASQKCPIHPSSEELLENMTLHICKSMVSCDIIISLDWLLLYLWKIERALWASCTVMDSNQWYLLIHWILCTFLCLINVTLSLWLGGCFSVYQVLTSVTIFYFTPETIILSHIQSQLKVREQKMNS